MRGKSKCKILKQIRQKIAQENDIPLVTKECTYQGECSGTCPRCEAELRYLEQQLARRRQLGKTVTVAALSLGLMASATACNIIDDLTRNDDINGFIAPMSAPAPVSEDDHDTGYYVSDTGELSTDELILTDPSTEL